MIHLGTAKLTQGFLTGRSGRSPETLTTATSPQSFAMRLSLLLLFAFLSLAAASPQGLFDGFFRGNRDQGPRQGRQRGQETRQGRQRQRGRGQRQQGGRQQGRRGSCAGGHAANHRFDGKDYLVSWRIGCSSFSQGGAERFCRDNGMRPISIDSSAKEREFLGLVGEERQKYFWTGGHVSGRSIRWPSGRRYNRVNWSSTGG